jgi:hypothetical protein
MPIAAPIKPKYEIESKNDARCEQRTDNKRSRHFAGVAEIREREREREQCESVVGRHAPDGSVIVDEPLCDTAPFDPPAIDQSANTNTRQILKILRCCSITELLLELSRETSRAARCLRQSPLCVRFRSRRSRRCEFDTDRRSFVDWYRDSTSAVRVV